MSKAIQRCRYVGWTLAWLAAAGLCVVVCDRRSVAAPEEEATWKTLEGEILPVYQQRSEFRNRYQKARLVLSGGLPYAGNEAALEEFFMQYQFPTWTLTDEEHLGALAKDRERFTQDLAKSPPAVHDKLVELTYNKMSQIAQDQEFHPGVRYNAVLLLGSLNAKEPSKNPPTNPEPLPKVLPILEGLFDSPDESDAVRVAALLGILRHLEWDDFRVSTPKLAAGPRADNVQRLIDLAQASKPPAGRSLEGHTWMRRRAVEGLLYVSTAGVTREVADVIEKLIADDSEPIALRCTAADTMGRLPYKAPIVPAAEINGKGLGLLALAACQAELTRLEEHERLAKLRTKLPDQYGSNAGAMIPGLSVDPAAVGGGLLAPPPGASADVDPAAVGGALPGTKKGKKTKTTKPKAKTDALDALGQGPGVGSNKEEPKNVRLDSTRRRMRAWLYAVQIGLGDERANPFNEAKRTGFGKNAKVEATYNRGLAAYTQTDEQKTLTKDLIVRIQDLASTVEAPDTTYDSFADELREKMKQVEEITGPLRAVTEPPKEGPPTAVPPAAAAVPDAPVKEPASGVAAAPKQATSPAAAKAPAATAKENVPVKGAPAPE